MAPFRFVDEDNLFLWSCTRPRLAASAISFTKPRGNCGGNWGAEGAKFTMLSYASANRDVSSPYPSILAAASRYTSITSTLRNSFIDHRRGKTWASVRSCSRYASKGNETALHRSFIETLQYARRSEILAAGRVVISLYDATKHPAK